MKHPARSALLLGRLPSWLRSFAPWLAGAAAIAATSCLTTTSTTIALPGSIPGATFVGSAACADCHADVNKSFANATHANIAWKGTEGLDLGCEACHGPGSKHIEEGGTRTAILNPNRDPSTCMQCHINVQGQFHLPSAHPVASGKVTCTDCHEPHGAAMPGTGTHMAVAQDNCLSCHQAQRGPFVFEHEAMREGCTVCHEPHGSVHRMMLKSSNVNLCMQCHTLEPVSGTGQILIGGRDHASFMTRGTCWSAGCHEAVHGSNANSSLRY